MKLCEHPEFEQAVIRAAEHFTARSLRPAIIEKDYYVTEALRILANVAGDKIIFKGGTSLSKGWNLIERFSEDIDIFLDPQAFCPQLGTNAINRELKRLRDAIALLPGLVFLSEESKTIGGFGRSDRFFYKQMFAGTGEIANRVLVESGTASGREPVTIVSLSSYLAQFLNEAKVSLGAEDESSFTLKLLHFRRTFIEKLFAIHGKVELYKRDSAPLGSYARHYYDLYQLSLQQEVLEMLRSDECEVIKKDYDQISRTNFERSYFCPDAMSFSNSDALFPPENLSRQLGAEYEQQCKILCYGSYPTWREVVMRFEELRSIL